MQFNLALRNGVLGTNDFRTLMALSTLYVRTGSGPAISEAMNGSLLFSIENCSFAAPDEGIIEKDGTWTTASAAATGTAGYFRLVDATELLWIQGTCGVSSGDLLLSTTSIVAGRSQTIDTFALTFPAS